ncbi:MAG: aldo/keto reductase [Roseibium sp.]|uniref:aldo/keto reductase n=1 Tax=Roseibium sp. TaxID=1936156 RepID=UPI0032646CE3
MGQSQGHGFDQSVAVVRAAIDAGVNIIDTAAAYGTEEIVGTAMRSCRDKVVVSSKHGIVQPGTSVFGREFVSPEGFVKGVEGSLTRLATDYIDIYHLHGVMPDQYEYCRTELLPALSKLRDQGKIRFFGLTERFIYDTNHQMLRMALSDDHWDVVMAGFNMMNPSARQTVFEKTSKQGVGTMNMFAVRRALSNRRIAAEFVRSLVAQGLLDRSQVDELDPLGFIFHNKTADTLVEAAYRFCKHEPGVDVVLTGTGSTAHLSENLGSILKPELSSAVLEELERIFGKIDSISGN